MISEFNTLKSRELTDIGLQINIDYWLKFSGPDVKYAGCGRANLTLPKNAESFE